MMLSTWSLTPLPSFSFSFFSGVPCQVCGGSPVREGGIVVPSDNNNSAGFSCEEVVLAAEKFDETSVDCANFRYVEALCCPSAASTCSICEGAELLADVEVEDYTGANIA